MRKNDVRPQHSDHTRAQPAIQSAVEAQADQPAPHQPLASASIQDLQRTCGNQFVQRLLVQRTSFRGNLQGKVFNQLKNKNINGVLVWEVQNNDLGPDGRLTVPITVVQIAAQLGIEPGTLTLNEGTTINETGDHTLTLVSTTNKNNTLEFKLRIIVGGQPEVDVHSAPRRARLIVIAIPWTGCLTNTNRWFRI